MKQGSIAEPPKFKVSAVLTCLQKTKFAIDAAQKRLVALLQRQQQINSQVAKIDLKMDVLDEFI